MALVYDLLFVRRSTCTFRNWLSRRNISLPVYGSYILIEQVINWNRWPFANAFCCTPKSQTPTFVIASVESFTRYRLFQTVLLRPYGFLHHKWKNTGSCHTNLRNYLSLICGQINIDGLITLIDQRRHALKDEEATSTSRETLKLVQFFAITSFSVTYDRLEKRMSTHRARPHSIFYHSNGAIFVNFVWARKNLTSAKSILQANAAFIVSGVRSALVISQKSFVQTNVAYITMVRFITVDSTDATLVTMEWTHFVRCEMLADCTIIWRHSRITTPTDLASFVNLLLVVADAASQVGSIDSSWLALWAFIRFVVAPMTRVKLVTARKLHQASPMVVSTQGARGFLHRRSDAFSDSFRCVFVFLLKCCFWAWRHVSWRFVVLIFPENRSLFLLTKFFDWCSLRCDRCCFDVTESPKLKVSV